MGCNKELPTHSFFLIWTIFILETFGETMVRGRISTFDISSKDINQTKFYFRKIGNNK